MSGSEGLEGESGKPVRNRRARLTEGSVARHLTAQTLPMISGLIAAIGFNIADTYFVAKLGTDELAAISFSFPVVLTIISLGVGLSMGSSSVIARAVGAEGHERAKQLTTGALTLSILLGAGLGLVGLVTMDPLFRALGAEEELLPLIKDYMTIWYLSVPLVIFPMVGNGCMRGVGLATIPSMIMNFAALLNVILDPLLIFGLWGFPRMEMEGAALATSISRAGTLVASILVLHYREDLIDWRLTSLASQIDAWRRILHIGLPTVATQVMAPVSAGIVTAIVAGYGATAVAGFGVATRLEAFALIPIFALSASISPFIGQNWAAGLVERVERMMRLAFLSALISGLLAALVLLGFADLLVKLFNPHADVVKTGTLYLLIVPFTYAFMGVQLCASSFFNSLGKPRAALLLGAGRMFALYVPLAWILGELFGLTGIFAAAAAANLAIGVTSYLAVRRACVQTDP